MLTVVLVAVVLQAAPAEFQRLTVTPSNLTSASEGHRIGESRGSSLVIEVRDSG